MSSLEKNQPRGLGRGLGSLFADDAEKVAPIVESKVEEKKVQPPPAPVAAPTTAVEATAPSVIIKEVVREVVREEKIPDENRIWMLEISKLKTNNFQPRKHFDKDKIQELSASIKEQGILQPIVARRSLTSGDFEIIAGERRWRAAQLAGLHQVPVILKDIDDQKSLELALIENIQRENLNPIEEAEAYEQLAREFSLTQAQISEKVGKDRATVANSLRLLGLAPEVKTMLIQGEITAGHAKALLVIVDHDKQREVAKKIASEKLTVRAAEKLVKQASKNRDLADIDENEKLSQELAQLMGEDLQKALGTKVKIDYNQGIGKLTISFYSDAELNQITERIKIGTRNSSH